MRDLQNRYEKAIGHRRIRRSSLHSRINAVPPQQSKMAFLERNLEQLTIVQTQVCCAL